MNPRPSPRSRREPRRKAADARPLRPRPRSSLHKLAFGSLERAPATASPPAKRTSCPCAVFLLGTRLDDRNDAAVRLDDYRLAQAGRFREFIALATNFEHGLSVGERDPLDRALADREAERSGNLARACAKGSSAAKSTITRCSGRAHPTGSPLPRARKDAPAASRPILWLPDLDFAKFRMPAEFFSPWRCI